MKRTVAFIFAFFALAVGSVMAQDILVDNVQIQAPADSIVLQEAQEFPVEEVEVPKVDKQIFNHLAAGVPITMPLLPQGIGVIELATTLTPIIQLRLGYTQPILPLVTFYFDDINKILGLFKTQLPSSVDYNGTVINLTNSKLNLDTNLGGINFLVDVFPGKKTPFHFTFGLYFNPTCMDHLLEANLDLSSSLKDAGFNPNKYNEVYFGFNEDDPRFRISPNRAGVLKVGINTLPVHPYVGIGFGRAIRPDRRVCVSFDMGVIYMGSPMLVGYDYSLDPAGTAVGFTPERVSATRDLKDLAEPLKILSNVPVYPMMKLNIFIRII